MSPLCVQCSFLTRTENSNVQLQQETISARAVLLTYDDFGGVGVDGEALSNEGDRKFENVWESSVKVLEICESGIIMVAYFSDVLKAIGDVVVWVGTHAITCASSHHHHNHNYVYNYNHEASMVFGVARC